MMTFLFDCYKIIWIFIALSYLRIVQGSQKFPDYFQFGAGTSAYQVEGAWNVDGKGLSIWDVFTHDHPELMVNRSNGDNASKSYYFYKDDVKALKELKMNFYRFSFAWTRILPNGDTSVINERGLLYYDNLINELLANNIQPLPTIFHWDLPQKLQNLGGLLNENVTDFFREYARILFDRYADRVKFWLTINEPFVFCQTGYSPPSMAPYVNDPNVGNYLCGHNLLIAHAKIYHLYHDYYFKRYGGKISFCNYCAYAWPKNPHNMADVAAAERMMQFYCGWFGHPVYSKEGGYPNVMVEYIGNKSKEEGRNTSRLPEMSKKLQKYIQGTADFFGLNYYTSYLAEEHIFQNVSSNVVDITDGDVMGLEDPSWPQATNSWVYAVPSGLRAMLNWITKKFNNPEIKITENGWSYNISTDQDVERIAFFASHFQAILDAIDDGSNVTAHTSWSLIDDLEFKNGYTKYYGIYKVNFSSCLRERSPRESASFHRNVTETRIIPESAKILSKNFYESYAKKAMM